MQSLYLAFAVPVASHPLKLLYPPASCFHAPCQATWPQSQLYDMTGMALLGAYDQQKPLFMLTNLYPLDEEHWVYPSIAPKQEKPNRIDA